MKRLKTAASWAMSSTNKGMLSRYGPLARVESTRTGITLQINIPLTMKMDGLVEPEPALQHRF
jgi:hypothetical protein